MRAYHVITVLVVCMASTAVADPGSNDNDAGSGADAGNVRSAALLVEYGQTYAGRVRGSDIDWYEANVGSSGVTCVEMTATSSAPSYFAFGQENAAGTTSSPILLGAGTTAKGGIAGALPLASTLRVARAQADGGPGYYDFRFARSTITSGGDGGSSNDAGGSAAEAMPITPGCLSGHLSAIGSLDMKDIYQISVAPGEVVTYSLASNTGGHTLSLLNAAGDVVGPVLETGQRATVALPTSGSYYLAAQRTTAVGDVGYLVGAVVGPDPTGCRPYCVG